MAWVIRFEPRTEKDLRRIDRQDQRRIIRFLTERIARLENPRQAGEALHGEGLGHYWKYRVGDYRIICDIRDSVLTIVVVRVGHRREVYR